MNLINIRDKKILAEYFRKDPFLHLYCLGDLDDFFWSKTTCYGVLIGKSVDKVVLVYNGGSMPVLLALSQPGQLDKEYINQLIQLLPDQFYAHLSPSVEESFSSTFTISDYGDHYKMGLQDPSRIEKVNTENTCPLTEIDLEEIQSLYQSSYPGNAFDPRMLLTRQYVGYRRDGRLLSIGGVHVYSPAFRVAALGNITTHPEYRNQGLGRTVTAKLCLFLQESVDVIGLNVKQDNSPALSLYRSLGFEISAEYGEFLLKKRL
jgi:ribosomal protein S18 acetylase RimI-like enzyme